MPLSDSDAVAYALLTLCAEDMFNRAAAPLAPPADVRIAAAGWQVVAYLTAQDVLFPSKGRMALDQSHRVFYGFLARNVADPNKFVVAVRGTEAPIEWFIDADFLPIAHPRYPQARVEQGFWGLYQTMSLADPATGATTYQHAAEGIEKSIADGSVVVAGHSLGAALATYLAESLARRLRANASACLFASPQTGDGAWVAIFDQNVGEYRLFNYILDIVPHVPTGEDYAVLPKRTIIQPGAAQAGIRLDLGCNHHLLSYCALLDYAQEQKAPTTPQDITTPACILGDYTTIRKTTEAWAWIVTECGVATEKARLLLKGLHEANAV
jgi:triacylglycerol lipase